MLIRCDFLCYFEVCSGSSRRRRKNVILSLHSSFDRLDFSSSYVYHSNACIIFQIHLNVIFLHSIMILFFDLDTTYCHKENIYTCIYV